MQYLATGADGEYQETCGTGGGDRHLQDSHHPELPQRTGPRLYCKCTVCVCVCVCVCVHMCMCLCVIMREGLGVFFNILYIRILHVHVYTMHLFIDVCLPLYYLSMLRCCSM